MNIFTIIIEIRCKSDHSLTERFAITTNASRVEDAFDTAQQVVDTVLMGSLNEWEVFDSYACDRVIVDIAM